MPSAPRPETLGHYVLAEKLGAGGMGEVYRAADTRLGRHVAIKVLPEAFARDRDRQARFEREARLLASLNHPNIATLHGYEQAEGVFFLVMELVQGETLAAMAACGPMPLDDVTRIFPQIAAALEAAHASGIIHRDLKPANIKVTPEGRVKVLDFGLAKAFRDDPARSDPAHSPTITLDGTRGGVILGTAAYMSPEQARAKAVDKRTDIWSFGCVLYECLTGRKLFEAETLSDTIAAILGREPDWGALPRDTPLGIRLLLRRCLHRDPDRRLHDIADARIELEDPSGTEWAAGAPPAAVRRWPALALGAAGLALGAVAVGSSLLRMRAPPLPRPVIRQVIALPPDAIVARLDVPAFALSPDGTHLVYVASRGGQDQLYLRPMEGYDARPVHGTEGARNPFFSHDSEWIGFFAEEKLKKVSIRGGAPVTLCSVELNARGASWGDSGSIVFQPAASGPLYRVAADGGTPQALTQLVKEQDETRHLWPQVLPDRRLMIFTLGSPSGKWDEAQIVAQSLDTGERHLLVTGGTFGRYVPTGHLVYAVAGALLAVPLDLDRLEITGTPVAVVDGILQANTGAAHFSFSATGTLVWASGGIHFTGRNLVWVNRRGEVDALPTPARPYVQPRISPDGRSIAAHIDETRVDVWLYDIPRSALTRLTFGEESRGDNCCPTWTPDGRMVTYAAFRGVSEPQILRKAADGSGREERLVAGRFAHSWSPEGRWLAFTTTDAPGDIWILPADGGAPQPFLQSSFQELSPVFSPDGRFLAYVCDESGRFEVYVRPFPGPGGKWPLSTDGGTEPAWAPDGREIFYRNGDQMLAVRVASEPEFRADRPRLLFTRRSPVVAGRRRNYDVSPDGQKFLMIEGHDQQLTASQLHLVIEWFADLESRFRTATN